jgi:hypothetical protein
VRIHLDSWGALGAHGRAMHSPDFSVKYLSLRFFSCEQFQTFHQPLRRTVILSLDNRLRETRRTVIDSVSVLQLTKETTFR